MPKRIILTISCLLISSFSLASDRLFPIWGDMAEQRGMTLPLSYGIGISAMPMQQDYLIDQLDIKFADGSSLPISMDQIDIESVEGESLNHTLRADVWLFPFLNLYGIYGYTEGGSDTIINIPAGALPGFGDQINFKLDYEGPSYGGGLTLAYGIQNWFITLDANYTESSLNISDSLIRATVTTLRTGILFNSTDFGRGSLWIGTMHQDIAQTFGGTVDFLPGYPPVDYEVTQSGADPSNIVAGTSLEITQHWYVTLEAGFDTRQQFLGMLMYRF